MLCRESFEERVTWIGRFFVQEMVIPLFSCVGIVPRPALLKYPDNQIDPFCKASAVGSLDILGASGLSGSSLSLNTIGPTGVLNLPELIIRVSTDAFLEKASVVHYYHAGMWLELTGAD